MRMVYTVDINEDICGLDNILKALDETIGEVGFGVKASKLESDEEVVSINN